MDCRNVERDIQAYWDRELPPDQAARLRAHLGQCPTCHSEFGRMDEFLSSSETVAVPAGLRDRVLTAVLQAIDTAGESPSDRRDQKVEHELPGRALASRELESNRSVTDGQRRLPKRYGLIPVAWAGALAACIGLLLMGRPQITNRIGPVPPDQTLTAAPDPVAISTVFAAAFQPNRLAATAAAAAQMAALERVTRETSELSPPLQIDRRPLRHDWVPASGQDVQQLPVMISAFSTLGA